MAEKFAKINLANKEKRFTLFEKIFSLFGKIVRNRSARDRTPAKYHGLKRMDSKFVAPWLSREAVTGSAAGLTAVSFDNLDMINNFEAIMSANVKALLS
jgi:hypothetical protein